MSEDALQIAEKIREVKGKGEKERYTHLKAKFQRIARRDKKAFLSDQYKKIEESSRMGKTGDLFQKIRYQGNFSCKVGTVKDRNGMDLTEAKDIKMRWQEYTELYNKGLYNPDNHNGVITHPEPDILECELKWVLGSITMNKASGGDGIPAELVKILKYDVLKCYTQYVSKIGKLNSGHRTGKGQFSSQSQRRRIPKNAQTTIQLCSFPMLPS